MDRKVKVIQFGTGKMAVYTMRYVLEKGGEIVGAIDVNPAVIGKDISAIMGGEEKGVTITAKENAEAMLKEVSPSLVIQTWKQLCILEKPEEEYLNLHMMLRQENAICMILIKKLF